MNYLYPNIFKNLSCKLFFTEEGFKNYKLLLTFRKNQEKKLLKKLLYGE